MGDEDFVIDATVSCRDGECGVLNRIVINPVLKALTHLVVAPPHRNSFGRLVPVELVEAVESDGSIVLRCTKEQFEALDSAEETEFLPGASGEWTYLESQMVSFPYYSMGGLAGPLAGTRISNPAVTLDKVPLGEVEVRRGEHVKATDGRIGRVRGLVVDREDHRVSHFLLEEGHLWGKKEVAIPIGAVTRVDGDEVLLALSKDEIKKLPSVEIAPQ